MIQIGEIVSDPDLAQAFAIRRPGAGTMVEGRYTEGAATEIPALGVIQPASAEDRAEFLPEGERSNDMIRVYSETEIRKPDGEGVPADLILWRGWLYRVVASKPWVDFGFWQAWAVALPSETTP